VYDENFIGFQIDQQNQKTIAMKRRNHCAEECAGERGEKKRSLKDKKH
jgi:hypothetical protein